MYHNSQQPRLLIEQDFWLWPTQLDRAKTKALELLEDQADTTNGDANSYAQRCVVDGCGFEGWGYPCAHKKQPTEATFFETECERISQLALAKCPGNLAATLGPWCTWEVRAILETAIEQGVVKPVTDTLRVAITELVAELQSEARHHRTRSDREYAKSYVAASLERACVHDGKASAYENVVKALEGILSGCK